jgi:ribosome modulation factor
MTVIKLQLGNEEREKQKPRRSRQRYQRGFHFGTQDTIEGVSAFRIDSRTMKRENLWLSGYRVPLGDMILAVVDPKTNQGG